MTKLISFLKDDAGASAAEYALILAIVGLGIVTSAKALGSAIGANMNKTANCISNTSNCS